MDKKFMFVAVACSICLFSNIVMGDIFSAVTSGDTQEIEYALIEEGEDINTTDEEGKTPLMYAIEKSDFDTFNYLIANGADINMKDSLNNNMLMTACSAGKDDIVE